MEKASSFFRWCKNNCSFVTKELWHPLIVRKKDNTLASEDRDTFNEEDLAKLFQSKEYINGTHKNASHYWVPLLALFTGARENELCQLYKSDIFQDPESEILAIDINDNANDKKLKNKSSRRKVPIHPTLISIGFLKFVKSMESDRLFPELKLSRSGYQDAFSKWFNRTYRSPKNCDVGNGPNEKKDFHSFRHTVINNLEKKEVPLFQCQRLVGHLPSEGGITTATYGKKNSIKDNLEIIKLLSYSIDFERIRPWQKMP